jgi:hypothetical protein
MSKLLEVSDFEEIDPLNFLEEIALSNDWELKHSEDGTVGVNIEGVWQIYTLSLVQPTLSSRFRLSSTFEIRPPLTKMADFYKVINLVNEKCCEGSFTYCSKEKLMIFRNDFDFGEIFEIKLSNAKLFLLNTVDMCDKFYPSFQLACWSTKCPEQLLGFATEHFVGEA